MSEFKGYVSERFRDEPHALEWDNYLDYRCRWSPDDFGGVPPWDRPIPARQDWDAEVETLNAALRNLERDEERRGEAPSQEPEEFPTPPDLRQGKLFPD
jgi:hypothetical protein